MNVTTITYRIHSWSFQRSKGRVLLQTTCQRHQDALASATLQLFKLVKDDGGEAHGLSVMSSIWAIKRTIVDRFLCVLYYLV